jgi:hypothetical protein
VAPIHAQALDQAVDRGLAALDDLEETGAVEQQQAGDSVERVKMSCRLVDVAQLVLPEVEAG